MFSTFMHKDQHFQELEKNKVSVQNLREIEKVHRYLYPTALAFVKLYHTV